MKKRITYYDILGIDKYASFEEIKTAFRLKAKEVHPDINRFSSDANIIMALLNKAYQTLLNPVTRAQYDKKIEKINLRDIEKKEQNNSPEVNNYAVENKRTWGKWWVIILLVFLISGYNIFLQLKTELNRATYVPDPSPAVMGTSSGAENTQQSNQYTYPTDTPVPTIDCIGPDGKHLSITQKACDEFNNAWKPTPTPIPTNIPTPTSGQPTDTPFHFLPSHYAPGRNIR